MQKLQLKMAITLKSGVSSKLDAPYVTKVIFREIWLKLVVLIAPNSDWWERKAIISDGVGIVAHTC